MIRSGSCFPRTAPTMIASASAATMPTVEPIHTPTQSLSVARVTVASIVLSPSSARKNADAIARKADLVTREPCTFVVGQRVAAQGPESEDDERDAADDRDRLGGDRHAQEVADGDRHQVHDGGGDGDSADDDAPLVAQANVMAISWDLSPNSATKMTAKLNSNADSTADSSVVERTEGLAHRNRPVQVPGRNWATSMSTR